ncbi:H48 family flagellin FliC [Escherichia coli]|uniref:H48 family flagellin FliC n=1 Tax=Escherichia coli TaxID=562 RepID=UPI003B8EF957|nr:H48 family flagellin FliC [Escherichia coli]
MAQVINTNSLSLITQNNINKNQSALSSSIERLSSGLRINSAKDDAAGQAIANRFTSNIKGLTQAARNANDGISVAQTTEGALSEINNNLQRVRELTVQATTGTNSESDLSSIQDEIKSRLDEIDRVSGQTQFNGVNVLAKNGSMKIQVGANDNQTITIDLKQIDAKTLGLDGFSVKNNDTVTTSAPVTAFGATTTNNIKLTGITLSTEAATDTGGTNPASIEGVYTDNGNDYYAKITGGDNDGKYYAVTVANDGTVTMATGATANATVTDANTTKATTITSGGTPVQIDNTAGSATANLGAVSLVKLQDSKGNDTDTYALKDTNGNLYAADVNETTGAVSVKTITYTDSSGAASSPTAVKLGGDDGKTEVVDIDGKTYDSADLNGGNLQTGLTAGGEVLTAVANGKTTDPLKALDDAIASVDKFRSSLGAVQNRLDSAVTNLNNTTTNLSEAQSRIQDADYATEVSNMSKAQIIQQAGNSVLAKANQVPQQVLSLLQG